MDLIRNAKKPIMLIGSQATLPPVNPKELVEAIEVCKFPIGVYTAKYISDFGYPRLSGRNGPWLTWQAKLSADASESEGCST